MWKLEVTRYFDAAHFLPEHKGKCRNMHGHTYKVTATIQGDKLTNGMLIDFSEIKRVLDNMLPDHTTLNDVYPFTPTAENLAKHFYDLLKAGVIYHPGLNAVCVKVWEGRDACAVYEGQ